ncbi:MAG: response regulator, partial [Candidatus Eremiobacteraeota bacterium]|nr:response regulator [Candidatus Eremiobacteraeota bacterium]
IPHEVISLYKRESPDLILLDLNMPGLDGYQIMAQLRIIENQAHPPILVLTGDSSSETRKRALQEGAKDFLSKPFDQVELLSRIRNMLEYWLLYKQVRDQNKILEEKVHERTAEIQETQLETIQRLSLVAEYRDDDTGMHIKRMSQYAVLLGKATGMKDEEAKLLFYAAQMHDIGKIKVPDHVLLKPGKLTPDEWEVVKFHTVLGSRILSGSKSKLLQMAELIALTHHERWDGTGYPTGLKGKDIPFVSRLCSLADVFDALTSKRPYKEPWPVEKAADEIKRLKGVNFDPELTDLFLEIFDKILEAKNKYS